jgi:hypothetical protein
MSMSFNGEQAKQQQNRKLSWQTIYLIIKATQRRIIYLCCKSPEDLAAVSDGPLTFTGPNSSEKTPVRNTIVTYIPSTVSTLIT